MGQIIIVTIVTLSQLFLSRTKWVEWELIEDVEDSKTRC